ncbi:hypothetical protein HTZ84_10565 [Haloterrigena sp. SYSU A558-1]|uniref:Lycopene cyclase domain-containing protein n=1 Tax=Haloterrigena gelatinilytica TaxID=2741724 RepID=A0ABX2LAG8_9EURY|nr:hypothetical protein [Haloterrigena gelatinilytica]NUC72746.1 hypothetical protein [Haloterrigena gelatinilytica]
MSSAQSTPLLPLDARVTTWPAYLLTVCWPGAGHLYARQWRRGCCWAALCGAALVFLSPGSLLAAGPLVDPLVLSILRLETVAFADVAFPLAVLALSAIDLYSLAVLEEV